MVDCDCVDGNCIPRSCFVGVGILLVVINIIDGTAQAAKAALGVQGVRIIGVFMIGGHDANGAPETKQ